MKYTLVLVLTLQLIIGSLCTAQHSVTAISDPTEEISHPLDFSKRKKVFAIAGLSAYTGASVSLYRAWYSKYDRTGFHLFNDWGEWQNMDKAGHSYSAYMQATLVNDLSMWAGYNSDEALRIATLSSVVGQLTIEVMDGFSKGWGFSLTDLGANLLGTGGFYLQQKKWGEQRLKMKMSYWPITYNEELYTANTGETTSLALRAASLYGNTGIERFLKDYNGQTIWVTADIKAFFPDLRWPDILDLAIGYSADNLFGGFNNQWGMNGDDFIVNEDSHPRARQWVLALDYDLSSVYHSTKFGTTLFKILDVLKFPAPGVSYDTERGWAFHLVYLR